jgi:aromatic amino acid aminotransferase I / 2-aminoadipate transaminase
MSPSAVDINVQAETDTTGVLVPNPRDPNALAAWRKTGSVPTGIAAFSTSDMFKSPACFNRPKAKRWDHYISAEAKARKPSSLKGAAKYLSRPGMISLGGGLPSSESFPFQELSLKVPKAPGFSEEETRVSGTTITAGKRDIKEGKSLFGMIENINDEGRVADICRFGGCAQLRTVGRVCADGSICHRTHRGILFLSIISKSIN